MFDKRAGIVQSAIMTLAVSAAAITLGGCATAETQAGQGGEYTRYVMGLYNDPATPHGLRTIEFPIHVAAAQIGQTSPDPAVLEKLRRAGDIFGRVEALPAVEADAAAAPAGRDPIHRLQSMARDQGADYLLIYGATVDTRTRVNSGSVVDLTIVGAFMPGTRNVDASARGSAALIDVRSGNVVLTTGAEAKGSDFASAASAQSVADALSEKVHDESLLKLADGMVAAGHRRADEESAMDDAPAVRHATPAVAREK